MRGRARNQHWGVVLETTDARALSRFYAQLLDWQVSTDYPGWVILSPPEGVATLAFQSSPEYRPPVWPPADGGQQMMMHLDIEVDDVADAVADALEIGATLAEYQPQDDVRVLFDPDGHPFCLFTNS